MSSETGLRASGSRRIVAGGLLACLLLVGGLRILAPSLLTRYLESRLGLRFGAPVSIGRCEFDFLARSITLRDVTIASPLPGAGRPLLRVEQAEASEVDVLRLLRDQTLRLERASLTGVDLATEGRSSGASSVAVAQDRIRGGPPPTEDAPAATAGEGEAGPWLRRIEIGRLSLHRFAAIGVENSAEGDSSSRAEFGRLRIERFALPIRADGGHLDARSANLEQVVISVPGGATSGPLLSLGRGQVDLEVSAAAGNPDELAIAASRLNVHDARVATTSDERDPFGLETLFRIWAAAIRGLDLPGVASIGLDRGEIRDAELTVERREAPKLIRVTGASVDAENLRHPQVAGDSATVVVRAHPLSESATLDARATGDLLAPDDRGPAHITATVSALPIARFPQLHLASGTLSGTADMTLSHGTVSGIAHIRLDDVRAGSGAPLAYEVAYSSFAALTSRADPTVPVPFSFELRDPDPLALGADVSKAVAKQAASNAGQSVRDAARSVGDAIQRGLGSLLP